MILSNLHTHTNYSDGNNTIEENIKKAIELGFESIGFSEHAECGFDIECEELLLTEQVKYFDLIDTFNEKYNQIQIYKGLELDSLNSKHLGNPDYTIGSVHCLKINDKIHIIDYDIDRLKEAINICGGEKEFLIRYFQEVLNFAHIENYDIVGHLDLYTKFNEQVLMFNTNTKWYKDTIYNVIEELTKLDKIIEINTGAICRGYRTSPYPDFEIIKFLKEANSKITVNSDSHSINSLNCYFNEIENYLKSISINSIYKLTKNGFIEAAL